MFISPLYSGICPIFNPQLKKLFTQSKKHIDMIKKVQEKFLRTINFKLKIPKEHLDYNLLQTLLNIDSLENRRTLLDARFIFKILSGSVDCPPLLENVSILVPQRPSQHHDLLFIRHHRINYGQSAPLTRMVTQINDLNLDIFNMSLSQFNRKALSLIRGNT